MISYACLSPDNLREDDVSALAGLLGQLLKRPATLTRERVLVAISRARVLVARAEDGWIIGMASLYVVPLLERTVGRVEEVVVDETMRGRGIGHELMQHLIDEARRSGVTQLFLTSKPTKIAANQLYASMGFERYETNAYKITL